LLLATEKRRQAAALHKKKEPRDKPAATREKAKSPASEGGRYNEQTKTAT
jgi:hypothetical protein